MTVETVRQLDHIGIQEIFKNLPHRYPFLLIDRIVDINGIESCTGIKNVTINEPQFQGHFPTQPLFPGVLILEAMAQTAGCVVIFSHPGRQPKSLFFMTIDEAKFRRPVVPGDRLELRMVLKKIRRDMYWYAGQAYVDGVLVAEAVVSAKVGLE